SSVQLSDCLSLFTEPEVLDEDHTWLCPHCKCQRQASKQMLLYRLPPILVIHIKRFAFNSFTFRQKIQDFVQFPLRDLDMSPYCVPNSAMSPSTYDLYAVINHHGFLLGGHYTTFAQYNISVKNTGWRFFDDSTVTPCSENDVITDGAYVLFYKKKDAE
ncbi:hypothetical protein HELRODRAFT_151311, partial [Helobdella robusta]|uniref:ubiquitinyl hydrolase 1 n=1 Tax=Helobdella robusta TaxID=6412 RepID=T1EKJ4_HELRO